MQLSFKAVNQNTWNFSETFYQTSHGKPHQLIDKGSNSKPRYFNKYFSKSPSFMQAYHGRENKMYQFVGYNYIIFFWNWSITWPKPINFPLIQSESWVLHTDVAANLDHHVDGFANSSWPSINAFALLHLFPHKSLPFLTSTSLTLGQEQEDT